jgi:hypothetical protein
MKIKLPRQATKAECDKLWSDCIKARAGYKSEISGKSGALHAHHLVGKPTLRLRYDLENGIALTPGEHFYIAHNTGRQEKFRENVKALRGEDIFERLTRYKWIKNPVDLNAVKVYLQEELKRFKRMPN